MPSNYFGAPVPCHGLLGESSDHIDFRRSQPERLFKSRFGANYGCGDTHADTFADSFSDPDSFSDSDSQGDRRQLSG
jgi:hypothetical protein